MNFPPAIAETIWVTAVKERSTVMARSDAKADEAMTEIWKQWFQFYQAHFRGHGIAISAADQIAFYEIARPIMRALATPTIRRVKRKPFVICDDQ